MTISSGAAWGSECWTFRFTRMSRSERAHLSDGLQKLAAITQQNFSPLGGLFGRYYVARCGRWQFAVVQDCRTRPPKPQIAAFDGRSVRFPTSSPNDRAALLRELGITAVSDAVIFHQMTSCDYGVLHKKCRPVILGDVAAANQCGIRSLAEYTDYFEQELMLCWQKWGGFLYAFKIDFSALEPFVLWKQIRVAVGSFRRLPAGCYR